MTSTDIHQFLSVFIATLPLVGVIGWAALQQNSRFDMLTQSFNHRMDRLEKRLDELGDDMKSLGVRINEHEVRIAKVETRLDGPRMVVK